MQSNNSNKNDKVKCGSYGCKNGRIRRTQSKSGSPLFFVNTRVSSNFNAALPLLHNKKEQVYYDDCDNWAQDCKPALNAMAVLY